MQPRQNIVIAVPEEHIAEDPEECTYCDGLEIENQELLTENKALKADIDILYGELVRVSEEFNRLARYTWYIQ